MADRQTVLAAALCQLAGQSVVALQKCGDDLVGVLAHLVTQTAYRARHGVDTGKNLILRAADRLCELRDVDTVAVERLHDHLLSLTRAVVVAAEETSTVVTEDRGDDDQGYDVLKTAVVAEEPAVTVTQHAHEVGRVDTLILKQSGEHRHNPCAGIVAVGYYVCS